MPKKSSRSSAKKQSAPTIARHVASFAQRLGQAGVAKQGSILLRLKGAGGGDYRLECGRPGAVRVNTKASTDDNLLEVTADASRIQAILEGRKNARAEFFSGAIRVRGDIQYAIDLAYEMGFIRERF